MSKKAKQYSPQEKAKVAMEAIKGDLTMAQISSKCVVYATYELLKLKRSSYDAKAKVLGAYERQIINRMDEIFTDHPYYGSRWMVQVLRSEGYKVGRKEYDG